MKNCWYLYIYLIDIHMVTVAILSEGHCGQVVADVLVRASLTNKGHVGSGRRYPGFYILVCMCIHLSMYIIFIEIGGNLFLNPLMFAITGILNNEVILVERFPIIFILDSSKDIL